MKDIGKLLSTYRKKAGLTQPQLADELKKNGVEIGYRSISTCVFCKPFLHKIAKSFCRLLHLHFVGNCKTPAGSYSASHKPLQILFSCYSTRYGNGSSEFSSSCACSLK